VAAAARPPLDDAIAGARAADVSTLGRLFVLLQRDLAEWQSLRVTDLQFWHRTEARLALVALVALTLVLLLVRLMLRQGAKRRGVVLPAILGSLRPSRAAMIVHAPTVLFLAGLPFFFLALADPFTALVSRETSFPGRRIGLLIDASISMRTPFTAAKLNRRAATDAAFFTTVAAAEEFVRLRMKGKYRDLIGLVEFGNQAYVIMPFTSDYDNVLLSISLIGDPLEFNQFPDQGTVIARAIDEIVGLYKAFNFLDASGNIMVIFSDGEDSNYQIGNKSLDDVVKVAANAKIPVYLVRTNYDKEKGQIIPDERWIPAIERTGGKFYAASDEDSLLRAIADIDRVATGSIQFKQYSSQQPRFMIFALAAAACWAAAALLKLSLPYFQKLS
jgi:VWA domain-containing protein